MSTFHSFKGWEARNVIIVIPEDQKSIEVMKTLLKDTQVAVNDANLYISELKEYLQENLTSNMAPSVMKEIEILKTAIANQKLEKLLLANKRAAKFISKILKKSTKTN